MRRTDLTTIARTRTDLATGRARQDRAAAGVTVTEIAATLGVTHQAVSAWEAGLRRPDTAHALAYARLLATLTKAAA